MPRNKKVRRPTDKKHRRAGKQAPAGAKGGGTKTLWDRLPALFVAVIVIGGGAALI